MNNDLISREDLKKALKSNCDTLCNDKNTSWCEHCCPLNDFEDLIDNAPTVDTTCPHCDSGYAQGYSDGYLKGIEERPQGKWLDEGIRGYVCSVCGDSLAYSDEYDYQTNYCPSCGAVMRSEEE